jgi:hypothetical protein
MYLDSMVDRVEGRAMADFDAMVSAVRVGTVIARDRKAARRWDREAARRSGRKHGLSGAALETAIMGLASTHPEYVVVG